MTEEMDKGTRASGTMALREEIIIDGVDVAGCVSFDKNNGHNICCYEDTREDKIPFAKMKSELAKRNQMLMDAHFQNKKLADELIITQNQYDKVVEQNKNYYMRNMELEKVFKWIKTQQYYILPKGFLRKIDEVINLVISPLNDVQK